MENVTTSQIRHMASRESRDRWTPSTCSSRPRAFADKQQTPSEEAVSEQFNQYKDNVPGDVSEANPFGFGYRLPDRVQFDYIALKLSDVAAIVKQPTEEDAEQYYQQNRDRQFTEKVPSDPNDPNSPQVDKVKSYVEVADDDHEPVDGGRGSSPRRSRSSRRPGTWPTPNLPEAAPTARSRRSSSERKKAGDYAKIAQISTSTYSIPLYSGRTGLLSAVNIRSDKVLRRMYLTTYGNNPIPLTPDSLLREGTG